MAAFAADRRHTSEPVGGMWIGRREFEAHCRAVDDKFGMVMSKLDAHDQRQDEMHAANQKGADETRALLVRIAFLVISALGALAVVLIKPYLHIP